MAVRIGPLVKLSVSLAGLASSSGHGNMNYPPSWVQTAEQAWFPGSQGTMWFTNNTKNVGGPTIDADSYLITYPFDTLTSNNPWRAPGTAPIFSPCGVSGGNPTGCPAGTPGSRAACLYAESNNLTSPAGCDCPGGGFGYGYDARVAYPPGVTDVPATEWQIGEVVEAAWAIQANHGGGYSYRLCKRSGTKDNSELTEECFHEGALEFVGDMQYVQYGNDTSAREAFVANRTSVGTTPAGSQWTKNPIPACRGNSGGAYAPPGGCGIRGPQFTPPLEGLEGYGESALNGWAREFDFSIVDKLQVPGDLVAGDYVLSFRWDCEQTSQVWTMCSDITLVA